MIPFSLSQLLSIIPSPDIKKVGRPPTISSYNINHTFIRHTLIEKKDSFTPSKPVLIIEKRDLTLADKHVLAVNTLSRNDTESEHNDPFDRILLAQAKVENLTFLTHDRLIAGYNEKCVILV